MTTDQSELVRALESGTIRDGFGPGRRIDTHLSHVFLTATRALKLKRAVQLPFVDFRTREQRRATLAAELAINRRTAPALYLGIEPITRAADGALALGGSGPALDYVLVMRRFPDAALFDVMARQGRLSVALIEQTAERVAAFHRGLVPATTPMTGDDYARIIDELRATEAHGARGHGLERSSDALFAALGRVLRQVGGLIEARSARGHVRHGHGDLHLGNLCLFDGAPTLFDALEFDVNLATTDTLYDFAFLLMDLRHRGLAVHANAAMNRYWDALGEDEAGLALLPFFMALRATVRMAVAVEAGQLPQADAYGALAGQLLAPAAVRLVAIGGLSGTGKSALARRLAPALPGPCGARLLRSDVVRKQRAGIGATERLAPGAYGEAARLAVYRALAARAAAGLTGASVIADATFRERETRQWIEAAAAARPFSGLWLSAPAAVRLKRVGGRTGDASDATVEVAARQAEPADPGANWRRIDASGGLDQVIAAAQTVLGLG